MSYRRVPFRVLRNARGGDIEAMTLILRHFEPFIQYLATVTFHGTSYLDTTLYDRLKTKLIMATLKFRL